MKVKNGSYRLDVNLILLLAGFYTLFNLVFLVKRAYFHYYFPMERAQLWTDYLLYTTLVDWVVVIAFMTLIAVSTKSLLNRKIPWTIIIFIHTILAIVIGIFIHFFFLLVGFSTGYLDTTQYSFRESIHSFMAVLDLNFLIYFAMVFIIYIYYYVKQVREAEKQRNLLEHQLVKTKIKMLTSQLQPHFLFNTLNSISVLAELNSAKARDTIADLSSFLREILYSGEIKFVPLRKELRTLEYYLNILNVRFSTDLTIEKEIDNGLLNLKFPAFVLQPLIENSVKHGYSYDHTELTVKFSVFKKDNIILIKVENNGAPVSLKSDQLIEKGVGLSNIKDRLSTIYGTNYKMIIRNKTTSLGDIAGVETIIEIPLYHDTL